LQIPVPLIPIVELVCNVQKAPVQSRARVLNGVSGDSLAIPIFNAALAENVLEAVVINEDKTRRIVEGQDRYQGNDRSRMVGQSSCFCACCLLVNGRRSISGRRFCLFAFFFSYGMGEGLSR